MKSRIFVLLALAGALACGDPTEDHEYGTVEVTASAPTIEREVSTVDGWTIKMDRFLVSVAAITVAASDTRIVTASSEPRIFDAAAPGPKVLLSERARYAQPWDAFSLRIAPPTAPEDEPTELAPTVSEADRDAMIAGAWSILVEGKATKADVTKTLQWGFATATDYADCAGELDGQLVKGVVVPPGGIDSVDLVFRGDVLFSEDLARPGEGLRFDAIAAADADGDGRITSAELAATSLEAARSGGAPYGTADKAEVADLGAFLSSLTPGILASYRAKGTCVATPAKPDA